MAQSLRGMGVAPGSRVAFLGTTDTSLHYWAHLDGSRIVADMDRDDLAQFWTVAPAVRADILSRLEALDVRAVVASHCPVGAWIPLGPGNYCVSLVNDETIARERTQPGYTSFEMPEVVGAALDRKRKRE